MGFLNKVSKWGGWGGEKSLCAWYTESPFSSPLWQRNQWNSYKRRRGVGREIGDALLGTSRSQVS